MQTLTSPASVDTERLVLGAVLQAGDLMDSMRGTLDAEDFSHEKHRKIWRSACAVYDAGRLVDRLAVWQDLELRGADRADGWLGFMADLSEGVPLLPSLVSHAGILKEKTTLRRVMALADNLLKRCAAGTETADEIRASLSKASIDLTDTGPDKGLISTSELIRTVGLEKLLAPRRTEGLRLPWVGLNDALCGLHSGQMVMVAAATGRGKTSFALQAAFHATKQSKSVVVWSLEMSREQMFTRLINQISRADGDRARHDALTAEDRKRRMDAATWLNEHEIWFDTKSRTVPAFCASVRQALAKSKVGLVVVDYLQLIRFAGRAESRTREVGENSRSLKLAAMELGLPFVVLSQFKRIQENRDYTINDLKESGDIENDSDVILIMNGGKLEGDKPVPVKVTIGKQRDGPTGYDVNLIFHPPSQTFNSVEA